LREILSGRRGVGPRRGIFRRPGQEYVSGHLKVIRAAANGQWDLPLVQGALVIGL